MGHFSGCCSTRSVELLGICVIRGQNEGANPVKLFDVRKGELAQVSLSAMWFFLVLACYYVVRPVRDTFATNLSSDEKATLFTATLVVMLLVTPLYGLIVARTPRRWLVPLVYGFFSFNLLMFASVSRTPPDWLGKVFFVWVSVFNLFIVTLFWGTVVDCFTAEQGKRLFGIIAAAGTVGQIASSWLVQLAVEQLSTSGLLVCSAALLVSAIGCSIALRRYTEPSEPLDTSRFRWSAAWEGAVAIARSPLLLGIALFIIAASVCATFAYFQMTDMLGAQIESEEQRSAWLANVNEWTGYVTLILQSSVVSVLLRKLGRRSDALYCTAGADCRFPSPPFLSHAGGDVRFSGGPPRHVLRFRQPFAGNALHARLARGKVPGEGFH